MMSFDTTAMNVYLIAVLSRSPPSRWSSRSAWSRPSVVRNRRVRLARHQSLRSYYGPPPRPATTEPRGRARPGWQDRHVRHVYECPVRRADLHPRRAP